MVCFEYYALCVARFDYETFGLVKQTDITPTQQRVAGIAYSGGVVVSFLALALVVVVLQSSFGLQVGWGFQFQYPAYVIALATIVFAFGLSLRCL